MVPGSCLCGSVTFAVEVENLRLYRCHCSLCRKQSGTASNCAAIVEASHFHWRSGREHVVGWNKDSGYSSSFCSVCGSPAPRRLLGRHAYWVPAGLLDDTAPTQVVADFFLGSKASWDNLPLAASQSQEFPSAEEFFALMHPQ